jgi:hypothetical protein
VVKETRHLKCHLEPEEVTQRGHDAARLRRDIASNEAELKSITSTFKARVSTLEGQLDTALQEFDSGCTYRDVECHSVHNFTKQLVTVDRSDTGEILEERKMTLAEAQLRLRDNEGSEFGEKLPRAVRKAADEFHAANEKLGLKVTLEEVADRNRSEIKGNTKKREQLEALQAEVDAEDEPIEPDPALEDQPDGFVPVGYEEAEDDDGSDEEEDDDSDEDDEESNEEDPED